MVDGQGQGGGTAGPTFRIPLPRREPGGALPAPWGSRKLQLHVPASATEVPLLPAEFVPRPELCALLDAGASQQLTLLCAPAGYGKTLLLTEWVRRHPELATAWVSLDEDDGPRALWNAVLTGLLSYPDLPGRDRLHELAASRGASDLDVLADLSDALADVTRPIVIVIDDAHHLRDAESLRGLRLLLRCRGPLRLVLACRSDPALPVARLRLEGRLCELRADRLRLSADEASNLLWSYGLRLSREQSDRLHERTGGWVAGLRLATLSLRDHPEPDRFLAEFSGDERAVADYLVGEVLTRIPADERDVLRLTSICDPLPAGLAAELSGRDDAADVLDRLQQRSGLVERTGHVRAEYRTQKLLRSYLTADLHRYGPELVRRLHARAARWWSARDRPVDALAHATQAGDPGLLDELLRRWAPELLARGEHGVLRRALAAAAGPADAWTGILWAAVHLGEGDRAAALRVLGRSSRRTPAGSEEALLRAAVERLAGVGSPLTAAEHVPGSPAPAALFLAGRGAAAIVDGAGTAAGDLTAALDLAVREGYHLLELQCRCLLAAAAWVAGDHAAAAVWADSGLATAQAHGWTSSSWAVASSAVLAQAAVVRGEAPRALDVAREALQAGADALDPVVRFALRTAFGAALFDEGDRVAGLLELQEARAEAGNSPLPAPVAAAGALFESRAALVLGYPVAAAAAASWLAARTTRAGGELLLVRAWTQADTCGRAALRTLLAPLLDGQVQPLLAHATVEAWLLTASAALREGDRTTARRALRSALALAEPLDAVRPFTRAGSAVRALLVDESGGSEDATSFAARVLAVGRPARRAQVAPLTPRELDVLAELPSLRRLGEIADDLELSVNTVKSHVRAIYGKLGVSTRRTAVLAAHEQGLLTEAG